MGFIKFKPGPGYMKDHGIIICSLCKLYVYLRFLIYVLYYAYATMQHHSLRCMGMGCRMPMPPEAQYCKIIHAVSP